MAHFLADPAETPGASLAALPDEDRSFATFYRQTYRDMVRLAALMVGSTVNAEDPVQDSFVAVQRRWDRIGDPLHYTRRTVANRCRSFHRRRFLERRHAERGPEPTAELGASELTDVIMALPIKQRQAVVLKFYGDLDHDAIADIIGCRPGTVGSLVFRAMTTLRAALGEQET